MPMPLNAVVLTVVGRSKSREVGAWYFRDRSGSQIADCHFDSPEAFVDAYGRGRLPVRYETGILVRACGARTRQADEVLLIAVI